MQSNGLLLAQNNKSKGKNWSKGDRDDWHNQVRRKLKLELEFLPELQGRSYYVCLGSDSEIISAGRSRIKINAGGSWTRDLEKVPAGQPQVLFPILDSD